MIKTRDAVAAALSLSSSDPTAATVLLEEHLQHYRELGDARGGYHLAHTAGGISAQFGASRKALAFFEEAIRADPSVSGPYIFASSMHQLLGERES